VRTICRSQTTGEVKKGGKVTARGRRYLALYLHWSGRGILWTFTASWVMWCCAGVRV
jgi:hypothetical protein